MTAHHLSATLHRVTFTVTLPLNCSHRAKHLTRAERLALIEGVLALIEGVLAGDDRVELYEDSTAPLPLANLRRLTPGQFNWPQPRDNAIGAPQVTLVVLIHCPDTRLHSTRVVLMNWVDGFRNLRLGQFSHERPQEIHPQIGGLAHPDAKQLESHAP